MFEDILGPDKPKNEDNNCRCAWVGSPYSLCKLYESEDKKKCKNYDEKSYFCNLKLLKYGVDI